jgi:predicted HTH transcriptional regulator
MQIRNNTLITECSAYDFKEMLERKKVKSWLKSVSAFANTEASSFFTTFYNLNWGKNERIPVEEVAERVNSPLKKYPANEESSEIRFGESTDAPKNIGKTAQKIIDFVISDPPMSAETMAYKIGISSRAVEKQIAKLRSMGILSREGADFGGYWRIVINPQTEK